MTVGFFKSPDDLAKKVLTSIIQLESTHRVNNLTGIYEVQTQPKWVLPTFQTFNKSAGSS